MSIDALILLRSSPATARDALVRIGAADDKFARSAVRAIGTEAALVSAPCRYPSGNGSAEWRELIAFARRLAKGARHDDPRGVLVLPDEASPLARSYGKLVDLVGSGGHWISLRGNGLPTPASRTKAQSSRSRAARPPRARSVARSTRFACFIFPPPAFALARPHPAFVGTTTLEDGTVLAVVRELFSDVDALYRFVFEDYPWLAAFVTDPRGLLTLRGGAFLDARRARTYTEVVAKLGTWGGWLEK